MRKSSKRLSGVAVLGVVSALLSTPAIEVAAKPGDPDWLVVWNRYRATAGNAEVVENPTASAGAKKHAEYLVANRAQGHDEYLARKSFSREGLRAGKTGNVLTGSGRILPDREVVETLLTAPFHGIGMISEATTSVGFNTAGSTKYFAASMPLFWEKYNEPSDDELSANIEPDFEGAVDLVMRTYKIGGAWDASGGEGGRIIVVIGKRRFLVVGTAVRELGPDEVAAIEIPEARTTKVTVWPGAGSSVPLTRYAGNESPDPLAGCPTFGRSAGLPILFDGGGDIEFSKSTLTDVTAGQDLEICVLTSGTFEATNQQERDFIRSSLEGSAIWMPRKPLVKGHQYRGQASIVDGPNLDWMFSISTTDAIGLPADHPLANEPTPGIAYQLRGASKTPAKPTAKTTKAKSTKTTKKKK